MINPTKEQLADPAWWDANAPTGTTHALFGELTGVYWFKQDIHTYVLLGGVWTKCARLDLGEHHRQPGIVERPSKQQWRGPEDGLPPVGTVCVVCPHNTLWGFSSAAEHVREVLAYHGDFVWLGKDGVPAESTRIDKVDFWLSLTPGQIAAEEERVEFIAEICSLLAWDAEYDAPKVAAGKLYDAGYRKCSE